MRFELRELVVLLLVAGAIALTLVLARPARADARGRAGVRVYSPTHVCLELAVGARPKPGAARRPRPLWDGEDWAVRRARRELRLEWGCSLWLHVQGMYGGPRRATGSPRLGRIPTGRSVSDGRHSRTPGVPVPGHLACEAPRQRSTPHIRGRMWAPHRPGVLQLPAQVPATPRGMAPVRELVVLGHQEMLTLLPRCAGPAQG